MGRQRVFRADLLYRYATQTRRSHCGVPNRQGTGITNLLTERQTPVQLAAALPNRQLD
jgi:hypothetical protein